MKKRFTLKEENFGKVTQKFLSTFKQKVAGIKCHKNLKIKS